MTTTTPALDDQQLIGLLALLPGADSVELKLTVAADGQRSAVAALGLDPLAAQVRLVYFFDTPDLALNHHGVVVRARRVAGRGDDSVVKLRPVEPESLSDDLRATPGFGVEVDAMPGGYVCSASLKGEPRHAVRDTVLDERPLKRLFTKQQRAFFAEHAPDGVGLEDLGVLGPVFVLKLKGSVAGFGRKLVAELWLYPDGGRLLEMSTKCGPDEAFQVAAELRAWLAAAGVHADAGQETKTKRALAAFAGGDEAVL